jgi:multiple sugar transport system permease protein
MFSRTPAAELWSTTPMPATAARKPTALLTGTAPAPSRVGGARRRVVDSVVGYWFLVGAVVCFAMFSWWPMVRAFIMSFQRTRRGVTTWVGWTNYERIWQDPAFGAAWHNTIEFTLLALVFGYAMPFLIAVLFNEFRHAQGFLRVLVYLPVMLPPASALFLFAFAYQPDTSGIFNYLLHSLHLPTSQWVQSPGMTVPSLMIASTWMNMGSSVLIYLAALQNIPGELYEAAELDGAGLWRRIWTVTVPQTRLILSLMFMLQIVATMQLFIEPYILANGDGVENSAVSVVYLIYQHAYYYNDLNGAAALGVMLLIVLAAFSILFNWLAPRQD